MQQIFDRILRIFLRKTVNRGIDAGIRAISAPPAHRRPQGQQGQERPLTPEERAARRAEREARQAEREARQAERAQRRSQRETSRKARHVARIARRFTRF